MPSVLGPRLPALLLLLAAVGIGASCAPQSAPPAASPAPIPAGAALGRWVTPGERPGVAGCPLFPADHAWHASIEGLRVLPGSAAMIAATATDVTPLRGSFRSKVWMGSRSGIPVNAIDGRTARRVDVVVEPWRTDGGHLGVPIPDAPRFEGWPGKAWDAHLLVIDSSTCESRELLNVREPADDVLGIGGGRWYADSAARFDLNSNGASGEGATASQVSLLAGMIRFDEVAAGRVDHVMSASLSKISSAAPVWPAMGTDGSSTDPDAIPMGSWLRLRGDADLSGLGPQARVVADALREHGAVVADTGPGFVLRGEPDERWDDDDIDTLGTLSISDFEVVDASPMMVERTSYQLRR